MLGPGDGAREADVAAAREVGALAAAAGWIVVTGGRAAGVMAAACEGAAAAGGTCVGILPGSDDAELAPAATVAIVTGLGEARDAVVVMSSDALVACGMSAGTAAEVALALKARKPVVLLAPDPVAREFFARLGPTAPLVAAAPEGALDAVHRALAERAAQ